MNKTFVKYLVLSALEVLVVVIGMIRPYYLKEGSTSDGNELGRYQFIFFMCFITALCFVYAYALKVKGVQWLYVSAVFYLAVLTFYLLGYKWGIDGKRALDAFRIDNGLLWEYPFGILLLTAFKLMYQLAVCALLRGIAKLVKGFMDKEEYLKRS